MCHKSLFTWRSLVQNRHLMQASNASISSVRSAVRITSESYGDLNYISVESNLFQPSSPFGSCTKGRQEAIVTGLDRNLTVVLLLDNESCLMSEPDPAEAPPDPPSSVPVVDLFLDLCELLQPASSEQARAMAEQASEDQTTDFSKPWDFSDITLLVEEKPVHANKMILSMWSPVFAAMFRNDFKEKDAKQVALPEKSFDDVMELMAVLHPPNKEICGDNVTKILPLSQEYQIDHITDRCEEFLLSQASSIKNYLIAQKFNLKRLEENSLSYLKRAAVSRLRNQADFDQLDKDLVLEIVMEKCDKFESNVEALREVRMVLERKKPTTFPGMHMLCESCTGAREQQVDCAECMKSCCKKMIEIIRNLDR